VDQFNSNFVTSNFGISPTTVADLHSRYDWGTIYFMANLSRQTGRPISEIAALADQGMSCSDIANRYNVAMAAPAVCPPIGAGPAVAVQPATCSWIGGPGGYVSLTPFEARRLSKMGYTWQDIAVATNISMQTGDPVYQILQWTDRGWTWNQVAREYGVDVDYAMNIGGFPYQQLAADTNCVSCNYPAAPAPACPPPCPPVGAGPAPCPPPCPPVGAGPSPAPCPPPCPPVAAPAPCPAPCPPAAAPAPCPPTATQCPPGMTPAPAPSTTPGY
jgi:uncharacterized protein (DUF433 family)